MALLLTIISPNISVFANETGKYSLKTLGDSEYSDGVRFGKGYLMLKEGKFNNITPKTQFIYIDENGNKKEIKNTVGFNEIYLNTSGNVYYVDYSTLAVGKDNKVALMDVNGELYGGNNNFYSCVIHAGDNLFYTTNETDREEDKANTKIWTLRKKDGTVVKEFKNLDLRLGTRIYANGYEYVNHEENGEKELISIDKDGKVKLLGKGFDSFTVSSKSQYIIGYKQDYYNAKYSITVFDRLGNKLFELDNCRNIETESLDKYGHAKVTIYDSSSYDNAYAENIVNLKGDLVLTYGKYEMVKSYDNDMALAIDKQGNVNLVNYENQIKFDGREFAKKFGATYDIVTFSSYYVDSTMSATITDTSNSNDPGKTFFFDSNLKEISGEIEGYVADYDGFFASLYNREDENYNVIKNNGTNISSNYDFISLEKNNTIYDSVDIYENGNYTQWIESEYDTDIYNKKEFNSSIVARGEKSEDEIEYLILKDSRVIDKYSDVKLFINGHAVVEDNATKKIGVINKDGNEVAPTGKYNLFLQYKNSECFVGYNNNQAFLFSPEGKLLTEENKYKEIGRYKTNFYEFKSSMNKIEYNNKILSNNIAITTDFNNNLGLVRVVRNSDFDNDGLIDIKDISIIALRYGTNEDNINWDDRLDLNEDGIIDIYDIVLCAKMFD